MHQGFKVFGFSVNPKPWGLGLGVGILGFRVSGAQGCLGCMFSTNLWDAWDGLQVHLASSGGAWGLGLNRV